MAHKVKSPTKTSLVLEALRSEILTEQQLRTKLPQCNANQICAALVHLKKRHAIGFLADEVTTLYYATPEADDRTKVVLERVEEEKGSRRRKSKQPK